MSEQSTNEFTHCRRRRALSLFLVAAFLAAGTCALVAPAAGAPQEKKAKDKDDDKPKSKGKAAKEKEANAKDANSGEAETRPAVEVDPAKAARRAELVRMATDYLTNWYTKQLDSTDWMARAVATISVSRMPTPDATETLLKRMDADRHPVCRLVAWQAALSRAGMFTDEQHKAWLASTWKMITADLFHGDLRIGLLEFLGSVPADPSSRAYFTRLFNATNSLDSSDVPTLIAMGRCLRSWGDAEIVETLIRSMGNPSTAVRAELILQAAGADVPWNRSPSAVKEYAEWWQKNKDDFTARSPEPGDWKKLRPQYLAPPIDLKDFDVMDKKWRHEMELDKLQLSSFGFVVALDCSRSMRAELERLRRDIMVMFSAFSEIAREIGVGLTFFAPGGELKHFPLTDSQAKLKSTMAAIDIFGPPGEEEWAGAIDKAINANRWPSLKRDTARAIVIISDEPITGPQFSRAMPLAKKGAEMGFKLYGMMVQKLDPPNNPLREPLDRTTGGSLYDPNNPLYSPGGPKGGRGNGAKGAGWEYYNELAKVTGGRAIDVCVPQGMLGLGQDPGGAAAAGGGGKGKGGASKPNGMPIAPIFPGGGPTYNILTIVLTDAIGPGHSDRVEPLVKILVSYCQKAATRVPERRTWQASGHMEPNDESFK